MKQTYFREPKYSKNYLISKPQNLYEQYVNAFAFSEMNIISELSKTPVQPSFSNFSNFSSKRTPTTEREPSPNIIPEPSNDTQFPQNAIAQKHSFTLLQNSKTELYEYNKLLYVTTSSEFRTQFTSKIRKLEEII
ncbi:22504_t:CDS:2, partial [Rhizophagus irregularis]